MRKNPLAILNGRENNLKNVTLEIPHDAYTVVTGVSGSGKSSLAFDTVYAEGQRRYIETFSPYTRQFFDRVKKPNVDHIKNVRPAIAIQQRTRITNSRSTVGTITNLQDYLKILWSNLAEARCPSCGVVFENWTADSLARHITKLIKLKGDVNYLVCSRLALKHSPKAELTRLGTLGFARIYNDEAGKVEKIDEVDSDRIKHWKEIIVVLDRVSPSSAAFLRLKESVEQAFSIAGGSCLLIEQAAKSVRRSFLQVSNDGRALNSKPPTDRKLEFFTSSFCEIGGVRLERPKPSLFTFNHPAGACPECKGFGMILAIDRKKCVPDESLSIKEKALHCWTGDRAKSELKKLLAFCQKQKISTSKPWRELSESDKEKIFSNKSKDYRGVLHWFKKLERKVYKMHVRVFLSRYRTQVLCPSCHGTRLKPSALAYEIRGKNIADISALPVGELKAWLVGLQSDLKNQERLSREVRFVFEAIISRLRYLEDLGLPYLTLDRQARTLSGGETQRVNLATALGSELISTQFVLDEPSVGLHSRDTSRLVRALLDLRHKENSLLVVEHDLECIEAAENVIELGPNAGQDGGRIVYNGPSEKWQGIEFVRHQGSPRPAIGDSGSIRINKAEARNLKGLKLDIPLGKFVCLTGVSGSGKSSLVHEVLKPAWESYELGDAAGRSAASGFELIKQLLVVDQSPLAKTPRSNIATYTSIWEEIRNLLSKTEEARVRGLSKSSFSFNVDGGRCPNCKGAGFITEEMQFLSDVYLPCELCLGKRFQQKVLEVALDGQNADNFLNMTVDIARDFFAKEEKIEKACSLLVRLGLGHLTLGHPLSELSGGEAQRLKLVSFLQEASDEKALLVFDEPTTGLHIRDIEKLLALFWDLRDNGHSILCIEHNLFLIAASDWIIDLGPEGGAEGGYLVAEGAPLDLLAGKARRGEASHTEIALRDFCRPPKNTAVKKAPKRIITSTHDLIIRGAKEHNLKDLTIKIPLDKLIALTGVSGSGKSSIAKDIIYAEGQRRFLDCLSPYARQFIKELKRPEIDHIENVQPTICVYQHTFQPSRLSTVATMSEVYNYLRLLYAKVGQQYCPDHPQQIISNLSPAEITREIKQLSIANVRILAPIVKLKKGHHRPVLNRAIDSEIGEIRADGLFGPPSRFLEALDRNKVHSIDFVVGKLNPSKVDDELINEAIAQALSLGGGTVIVHHAQKEEIYSIERTCPICKRGFFKPDPEDLSFNSKRGACPSCHGHGVDQKGNRCAACGGSRLNPLGSNIRLNGKNIHQASLLSAAKLSEFLKSLKFDSRTQGIYDAVFAELVSRLNTIIGIGLDYLPLDRECATLSSGELQRLRLATAMGSPLTGAMYIFDEPSAGLHPKDTAPVLKKLADLKDAGNSVIMIEHDPTSILAAEYVIDIGPGGGSEGGELVFEGSISDFIDDKKSVTALHVRASMETAVSTNGKHSTNGAHKNKPSLIIENGSRHNVTCKSLSLPLNALVTVAGVSGAGKSSLVHGIIAETMTLGKGDKQKWILGANKLSSSSVIERVVFIDQKPIGINSRSTPASYLGIWDDIRKVFANTIEAKSRGWQPGHFSYNTGKGRCAVCKGLGVIKLEMSFLPDAFVVCEECRGSRYEEDTLSIHYQGRSISDVLGLTFAQAKPVFANHRRIYGTLLQACEIGLGYLSIGQSSVSLSGGESQRIKLVSELSSPRKGHTLYILDEPTTGLHKADVARLIKVLHDLIALGNSVIVIEHDEEFLYGSDHVIELGPGPGEAGGRVIFEGTPKKLIEASTPWGQLIREGVPLPSALPEHSHGPA